VSETNEYMPKSYTIDKSKDCLRCEEPGVIVWRGKVRKLCPRCFKKAVDALFAEAGEDDDCHECEDSGPCYCDEVINE
jgi:hypothetical protein